MARKKAVKKYTLAEFKAWLEGIEEIQPAEWHPDLAQWKMIRDKISAIVEPPVVKAPALPPAGMQHEPRPGYQPVATNQPPRRPPIQPSALDEEAVSAVPGKTAQVTPAGGMTPAAQAALAGKLPKEMQTNAATGSKTPNIDTMDGNYESSFT